MEIGKEKLLLCAEFVVTCYYGNHPLRGLFGVSSPRPEPQFVAPQPSTPTENIEYEIPSGMIEQLLVNPYAGDGSEHPDMHLIHVEQIYVLFKLAGLPRDEVMKKVFPLSLKGKALAWYRLCDCRITGSGKPLRFEHWGAHEDLSSL